MGNMRKIAREHAAARLEKRHKTSLIAALSCLVVVATAVALMVPAISASKADLENAGVAGMSNEVVQEDAGAAEDAAAEAPDSAEAEPAEQEEAAEAGPSEEDSTADESQDAAVPEGETDPVDEGAPDETLEPEDALDPNVVEYPAQAFAGELKNKKDEVIFTVNVEAPEGAFPAGTTMEVTALSKKDAKEAAKTATDAVAEQANVRVEEVESVDITFRDAEGNEIEPLQTVSMKFASAKMSKDVDAKVVHLDDQGEPAVVDALNEQELQARGEELQDNELMVDVQAFSVYSIVYTVDFRWDVDGKAFDFSIPGGGFASLSQLVEVLGIAEAGDSESDPAQASQNLVADVQAVEFSNPDLLSVSKVEETTTVGAIKEALGLEPEYSSELTEEQIAEADATEIAGGDWVLIGLQPFTSEETLTVTMKNGEVFVVAVKDGQLHTYAISASGDMYEVTVTYDDTAEIPDNAELRVRAIEDTEEEYAQNVEATNEQLKAQDKPEVTNPVQFDIAIVSDGVEVEPKEGSTVSVEIKLAPEAFGENPGNQDGEKGDDSEGEKTGEIWFNGSRIDETGESSATGYTVSHISDDGTAEVLENVESSVNEDEKIVLQFETESFSDYLIGNPQGLYVLPNTIRVGDEIYMWERADYWVTNIGSVVDETKHPNGQYGNDGSDWKTVRATNTGTFRIYNRYNQNEYKDITVLPAITETTPPGTIETVDNASIGLTLNLFDYDLDGYLDDYFNNYNHGNHPVPSNFLDHGINNGHALKFWGSGIGNTHGYYNQYQEFGVTSIVQQDLVNGYPYMADGSISANQRSLDYLFTPSNGTDKEAYTNVNHLFKKEGDYYVYDSNVNYAYYDKAQGNNGNFVVYNRTYKQKSDSESGAVQDKAIGFFPFHKWNESYDRYVNWNKNLNHHFGMSMSVPFSLPKDPKAVKDSNGQPIVFEFSGDDDMWVFIDGKLAMDIGGIHQPTSGTIDFMNKTVTVNGQRQNFDFSSLYDGERHTLQVFYLERGGADSNCKIKFNLTQYGDVEFDKVDSDDNTLLAGAVFGLYKDAACTEPLTEELKNGSRQVFIVETDANGHAKLEDVPLGEYYLKEIHAPDGYPIAIEDGTVRVRVYLDASGNVKTSVDGAETDAKILNSKPAPINLGLKKEWQNEAGQTITAPEGVSATFEIKRIRTYETFIEHEVQGEEKRSSHLTVGWIHNGQTHVYEEFDLVESSQATVSWSLADGYSGTIGCEVNGTRYTKTPNPNNIYSQGITMPAAGQSATIYIIDDSANGDAIKNINVAGSQFYGNSGGGFIHEFHTITEPDPDFAYAGANVTNNQVTLPIGESTWQYDFSGLPSLGAGTVTVDGKQQKVTYKYSYYLEEVSSDAPAGTTVVYKDLAGHVINSPTDAETHVSGTETVINKLQTTAFSANKSWVNQDGTPASLPAGTSIEFRLFADGKDTGKTVVLNGKTDVTEVTDPETQELNTSAIENAAYENKPWGAYWGNLPKYVKKDNQWVEINYTVSEKINAETGFLPEVNEVTEDGGTIKNVRKGSSPDPEIPDPDNTNPEIHKRIDALRDAVGNPDTALDDDASKDLTDLYRLYLDYKINSLQEPEGVDLLFVLDHSGSMNSHAFGGNPNRAPTVEAVLNGDDGLIAQFLAMNENNRWAAVGFKGDPGVWYTLGYRAQNAGQNDSEILSPGSDWQTQRADISLPLESGWPVYVPGEGPLNEGETRLTDYTAGLWRAEQFLRNNDYRKKIVVFISDGIPTLYIPCEGTLENAGTMTGSGYYPDNNGTGGCTQQTREQFANFVSDMTGYGYTFGENAEFYTVGFGDSILSATSGKALLKGMLQDAYGKDVSSTNYIGIGDGSVQDTASTMRDALGTLIGAKESYSNLVIQDDLSQYVDLYGIADAGNDPAAILHAASTRVTMTNPADTSQVIVLYQNGSVTEAGANILKSVSYDPATKTVKAEFKEDYKAEPGIRYTLSFDVKATQAAYTEFAQTGYSSTGDEDTDFKGTNPPNATSSGKMGFHSNDSAKATYEHNDEPEERTYKHPVVQAFPKIRIVKEDQQGHLLEGATFELYKEGYDPAKTSQENAEFKLKEMVSGKENADSTDALIYEDVLKPGTYYLVETQAPAGYSRLGAPVVIVVSENQETGAITVSASVDGTPIEYPKLSKDSTSGDYLLKVANDAGVELPHTGGPGATFVYVLGTMLVVLAATVLATSRKRRLT